MTFTRWDIKKKHAMCINSVSDNVSECCRLKRISGQSDFNLLLKMFVVTIFLHEIIKFTVIAISYGNTNRLKSF